MLYIYYIYIYFIYIYMRFNKLIVYRICHQIIQKYKMYMPYQSTRHTDKRFYKDNMRNVRNNLKTMQ